MNSMVTQDESNLVPAESLITLSVFENDLKRDQFEQLENDSNIKVTKTLLNCLKKKDFFFSFFYFFFNFFFNFFFSFLNFFQFFF